MGPIQTQRFRVLADFGPHGSSSDAEVLARRIREFRPHIFVPELAFMNKDEKRSYITSLNDRVERSRRSARKRRQFIGKLASESGFPCFGRFGAGQFDAVISEPGLRVFPVEFIPAEESSSALFGLAWALPGLSHPVHLLSEGRVEEALEAAASGYESFGKEYILSRNWLAAEGFSRLCLDVPEFFPELSALDEIRVLARYGQSHMGLADDLRSIGFMVEVPRDLPEPDFCCEVFLKMGKEPGYSISREDSARILFQLAFDSAFSGEAWDDGTSTRRLRMAFSSLGGEEGFLELASASSGDAFMERLRERLSRF